MQEKLNLENNKDKYYIAFSNILYNCPYFKAKIFEFFDYDIEKVFLANENDLKEFAKIYDNVSIPKNFLSAIRDINIDNFYEKTINSNTKYLTYEDEKYPKNLKNIEDFPLILYYKGNLENINFDKTIGIVGSRRATESAKLNVQKLVSGFINTDIVIVSGLASGIDAAAHKSAIENNLKTVAVIGSGLNYKYPAENKYLYNDIEGGNGVIFSEFPNDVAPRPINFPQRNRIVTGLSYGVLIAEAKMKSGAMISARLTLEQNRELMCMPGNIQNPNCEGIYHLIKNGASIVINSDDILNCLNWEINTKKTDKIKIEGIKAKIYELIKSEEISFEGLQQKFDVGINELMMELTEMEIDGLIIQKNGFYYIMGN